MAPIPDTARHLITIKDNVIVLARIIEDETVYSFDGAGRLFSAFIKTRSFRQSMLGPLCVHTRDSHGGRWQALDRAAHEAFYVDLITWINQFKDLLHSDACEVCCPSIERDGNLSHQERDRLIRTFAATWLDRIRMFQAHKRAHDGAGFAQVYHRIAILPPDQYLALVVQATQGCGYNRCTFCNFYKGVPFHIRTREEFQGHLNTLISLWGDSLALRRSLFLADANALIMPQDDLLWMFDTLNETFSIRPGSKGRMGFADEQNKLSSSIAFDGIYSFLDMVTLSNKGSADFTRLRQRGLRRVYIGMETGSVPLLKQLRKPFTVTALRACVEALHESDVGVGIIILTGIGGEEWFDAHVEDSVAVINELNLGRNDIIYLSRLVEYPLGDYGTWAGDVGITPLTDARMDDQYRQMLSGFTFPTEDNRPKISRYNIEKFVY